MRNLLNKTFKQLFITSFVISALLCGLLVNAHSAEESASKWYNPTSWFSSDSGSSEVSSQTNVNTSEQDAEKIAKASWWDKLRGKKETPSPEPVKTAPTEAAKPQPAEPVVKPPAQPQVKTEKVEQTPKEIGAVLQTQRGRIIVELYEEEAPLTVKNFKMLVSKKFYDTPGMKFHRVIPGFVVQTGDPTGTGYGGSDDNIELEVDNKLSHGAVGVLSMARGPRPNSASSQFYITLAPQKHLDGKYAVFGRVISGLEVLPKIQKDDMLYGVKLMDISDVERDEPVKTSKSLFHIFKNNS